MSEPQYRERFREALRRLMRDIDNLRTEQAAIEAYHEARPPRNRFLTVAIVAIQGDRLLRLVRIFEDSTKTASFWYLHRCEPKRLKNLDMDRLQDFSGRLKTVRDLTFVHIDKKGISDPAAIWRAAGFTETGIREVIETVRRALNDLWIEEFGKPPISISNNEDSHSYNPDIDGLKRLLIQSLAELSGLTAQSRTPTDQT
jgi:hypothetical protein